MRAWQGVVFELVSREGESKRTTARLASLGVNGAGLTVMLAVFAHTGGLTGAEVVVAGGTSAVGQKVLEAIFGDQAVRTLAARAREDLLERAEQLLRDDAARFDELLDATAPDAESVARLHGVARCGPHALREPRPRHAPRRARRGGEARRRDGSTTESVAGAHAVVAKAGARLGLGIENTVVALAGPTGVGKSQLFNALSSSELAAVSRRRPTTSVTPGGGVGQTAPIRFSTGSRSRGATGSSRRARGPGAARPAGLRLGRAPPPRRGRSGRRARGSRPLGRRAAEVRRRCLARALPAAARIARSRDGGRSQPVGSACRRRRSMRWRDDMARLLGRGRPSRRPGRGRLGPHGRRPRRAAAAAPRTRCGARAAVARLAADVARCCRGARERVRRRHAPPASASDDRARLLAALEDAAGVPTIVRRGRRRAPRRGSLATGWPFVRWIRRFRPDPLRRLRLPETPQPSIRTSLPPPTDVQRAQVATAARALADRAAEGLAAALAAARARRRDPGRRRRSPTASTAPSRAPTCTSPSALVARSRLPPARVRGRRGRRDALAARPRRARLPAHRRRRAAARALGRSDSRRCSCSAVSEPGSRFAFVFRLVNAASARRRGRVRGPIAAPADRRRGQRARLGPVEAELESYAQLRKAIELAKPG